VSGDVSQSALATSSAPTEAGGQTCDSLPGAGEGAEKDRYEQQICAQRTESDHGVNDPESRQKLQQEYDAVEREMKDFIAVTGAKNISEDQLAQCLGDNPYKLVTFNTEGSPIPNKGLILSAATDDNIPQAYGAQSETFFIPNDIAQQMPWFQQYQGEVQPLYDENTKLNKQLNNSSLDNDTQTRLEQSVYDNQMSIAYSRAYYENLFGHNEVIVCDPVDSDK
jgi:hypothetical protein